MLYDLRKNGKAIRLKIFILKAENSIVNHKKSVMKFYLTIGFVLVFLSACTETDKTKIEPGSEDTMVIKSGENLSEERKDLTNWSRVDLAAPIVEYDEIKSKEIEVREQDSISVFSVDETVLFDFDKATLRDKGEQTLDEIANSIKQRYPNGAIGIYGYTDSIGSDTYNQELSAQRANAVKQYLQSQTSINMNRINTYSKGETNPVATNATAKGRQQNRRVNIVAQNARD